MFKIKQIKTVILILFLQKAAIAEKYIVNGQPAEPKMLPYQVSVQYFGLVGYENEWSHGCGGSLINDHYVLTAAHCILVLDPTANNTKKYDTSDLKVYLGSENLKSDEGKYQKVTDAIPHKKFDYTTMRNDIGLLEIEKIFKFTEFIQPVFIFPDILPAGVHMLVSGWGQTSNTTLSSNKLLYIWTNNQEIDKCKQETKDTEIDASKICGYDPVKQTCEGDSGGPVVIRENNIFYQVGIVSYGYTECTNSPTVYTRLGYYLDWIQQRTEIVIANINVTSN